MTKRTSVLRIFLLALTTVLSSAPFLCTHTFAVGNGDKEKEKESEIQKRPHPEMPAPQDGENIKGSETQGSSICEEIASPISNLPDEVMTYCLGFLDQAGQDICAKTNKQLRRNAQGIRRFILCKAMSEATLFMDLAYQSIKDTQKSTGYLGYYPEAVKKRIEGPRDTIYCQLIKVMKLIRNQNEFNECYPFIMKHVTRLIEADRESALPGSKIHILFKKIISKYEAGNPQLIINVVKEYPYNNEEDLFDLCIHMAKNDVLIDRCLGDVLRIIRDLNPGSIGFPAVPPHSFCEAFAGNEIELLRKLDVLSRDSATRVFRSPRGNLADAELLHLAHQTVADSRVLLKKSLPHILGVVDVIDPSLRYHLLKRICKERLSTTSVRRSGNLLVRTILGNIADPEKLGTLCELLSSREEEFKKDKKAVEALKDLCLYIDNQREILSKKPECRKILETCQELIWDHRFQKGGHAEVVELYKAKLKDVDVRPCLYLPILCTVSQIEEDYRVELLKVLCYAYQQGCHSLLLGVIVDDISNPNRLVELHDALVLRAGDLSNRDPQRATEVESIYMGLQRVYPRLFAEAAKDHASSSEKEKDTEKQESSFSVDQAKSNFEKLVKKYGSTEEYLKRIRECIERGEWKLVIDLYATALINRESRTLFYLHALADVSKMEEGRCTLLGNLCETYVQGHHEALAELIFEYISDPQQITMLYRSLVAKASRLSNRGEKQAGEEVRLIYRTLRNKYPYVQQTVAKKPGNK